MSALAEFALLLPFREWKNIDWAGSIADAQGQRRRFLQLQEMAVNAIAAVEPVPLTPGKLGWCVLWARGFSLLQAAAELSGTYAAPAAQYLHRVAFELWLQVQAIRNPYDQLVGMAKSSSVKVSVSRDALNEAWPDVASRLAGFTAWALASDLVYFRDRSRDRELSAIHRPTDPATLPATAEEAALQSYVFGESEIVSRAEAARDAERAKADYALLIARTKEWLDDPELTVWREHLDPWIRDVQNGPLPSFFELIKLANKGLGPNSPRSLLHRMNAGHLYSQYAQGSLLLHGASIVQFVDMSQHAMLPRAIVSGEEGSKLCAGLADTAHNALLGLWGMRDSCGLGAGDP